jgi:ankyrin repeat protein
MDMPSLSKGKAIEESNGSMTVLTHAVLTNNLKLVKWLCAMGKDDVNAKDELGLTSAHYACQMGYLKALKYLAKFGANLELRTSDGYTPLMLSIIKGKRNCAEYLINECKCDLLTTDNDGLNVFQRCCASGELSMAKWLIENGGFKPYVNIPTSTTYTNTIKCTRFSCFYCSN